MKIGQRWIAAALAGLVVALSSPAPAAPLRALILTGQNNHDWAATTPVLKEILCAGGAFETDVTESPADLTAARLAGCRVLISNWNTYGKKGAATDWPEATRKAVLDFVRAGGGFVVVHAGGSMFADWPEFQRMIAATWGAGTGHGRAHEFTVRITDPEHPITKGLADFSTTDELWHRMAKQPDGFKVLAVAHSAKESGGSGQDEPMAYAVEFGQGRCFNLVLGHDANAMRNPGFRTLLRRGAEWAATGRVTLAPEPPPDLLAELTAYRFGQSPAILRKIERQVAAAADPAQRRALAARFAALLTGDTAPEVKQFACGQLGLIGGAREVPVLAALLTDEKLGYAARSALERIGSPEAVSAIESAWSKAPASLKLRPPVLWELAAKSGPENAAALRAWTTPEHAPHIRRAAWLALLTPAASGDDFVKALAGDDAARQAAVRVLATTATEKQAGTVAEKIKDLPPDAQIRILQVLTRFAKVARAAAQAAITSPDEAVRRAAVVVLGDVGSAEDVPSLLQLAADGPLADAAFESLARIDGSAVDAVLLKSSLLPPAVLYRLCEARRVSTAGPLLLAGAVGSDPAAAGEALKALTTLARPADAAAILAALPTAPAAARTGLTRVLVAIARQEGPDGRAARALAAAAERTPTEPLLTALAQIGGPAAAAALEKAVKSADAPTRAAAVRALGTAVTLGAPAAELLARLAETSSDAAEKSLALRGFLTFAERSPADAAAALVPFHARALAAAATPEEKKTILGLIGRIGTPAALDLAVSTLDQPALAPAAAPAVMQIVETLGGQPTDAMKTAVKRIVDLADAGPAAEQARAAQVRWSRPVNIASKAVATSPDGIEKDGASDGDAAAIDGKLDTYWDEDDGQKEYRLLLTWPAPVNVVLLRITGWKHHQYAPKDFDVVCDGKVVKTVRGAVYADNVLDVAIPETQAATLELRITGSHGPSPAIRELEVY